LFATFTNSQQILSENSLQKHLTSNKGRDTLYEVALVALFFDQEAHPMKFTNTGMVRTFLVGMRLLVNE